MTEERFVVFWTIDHGFRLASPARTDAFILPVFAGDGIEAAFTRFFANDHLAAIAGKKVYCDCAGDRAERDGMPTFTIRRARLFAE